jgi:hypothetical protein
MRTVAAMLALAAAAPAAFGATAGVSQESRTGLFYSCGACAPFVKSVVALGAKVQQPAA